MVLVKAAAVAGLEQVVEVAVRKVRLDDPAFGAAAARERRAAELLLLLEQLGVRDARRRRPRARDESHVHPQQVRVVQRLARLDVVLREAPGK